MNITLESSSRNKRFCRAGNCSSNSLVSSFWE